ncbi:hypothetical protein A2V68_01455 [candidate division Kazan bacterium RBG_13_50_9]|uniref:RNA-binding protein KhpA n=1 Tax=candidate division Kazan bacterium RBG_13_50_9 TaxID=1798535 RepID=A0A1F4NRZ1_UNCK3|nr:MAG: hypothetical protein A2V68_01455 [candidate division Kazan bacterium RBG_13_50_9]
MADNDKEFVEYVVKAIVDNPGKVKVNRKVDEMGVLIELTVDPADMGKIIGKEGRTAKAVRTLLRVLGAQTNARINLKIIEPEGGTAGGRAAAPLDEDEEAPQTTTKDDLKELTDEE